MILELKRSYRRAGILDGVLYVNGEPEFDTSENAAHALPPGPYRLDRRPCRQYGIVKAVLLVQGIAEAAAAGEPAECAHCPKLNEVYLNTNLPVFCPQIKMGNGIHGRTDGSILIGTRIVPGVLKPEPNLFASLHERIRKEIARGAEITLVISEKTNPL